MTSGIYKIENTVSGKLYIGSAINIATRIRKHKESLKRKKHHSIKLQNAWNKYGADVFNFEIILVCDRHNLIMYEQAFIDFFSAFKDGYNMCPAAGNRLGLKHSIKTKIKMSAAYKNRSQESISNVKASRFGAKRNPMSLETKIKIGNTNKGRVWSDDRRAEYGRIRTGEKRKPCSEERKAKIGPACTLRKHEPHSKETRLKIKAALQAHWNKKRLNSSKEF